MVISPGDPIVYRSCSFRMHARRMPPCSEKPSKPGGIFYEMHDPHELRSVISLREKHPFVSKVNI